MSPFGKHKKDDLDPTRKEPRLRDANSPQYSSSARDAFVEVLIKGRAVLNPAFADVSYTDAATDLDNAVQAASSYCNDEMLARLNTFHEAVIDASMGESGSARVEGSREHFVEGCRLALGTND